MPYDNHTFTFDEVRHVLDYLEKNKCPDVTFGDDMCNLHNAIRRSWKKAMARESLMEELCVHTEFYLFSDGRVMMATDIINTYERNTGRTATDFEVCKASVGNLYAIIPESEMTYEFLLSTGNRIRAMLLYCKRTGCNPITANKALDKLCQKGR